MAVRFDSEQPAHQDLRNIVAERTTGIVFWVGAGLSKAAGLPLWGELREDLCMRLAKKIATQPSEDQAKLDPKRKAAQGHEDLWAAMGILKEALGDTDYRSAVRQIMKAGDDCEVPSLYRQLWSLQPRGIINLNIDRLATRAFGEVCQGKASVEFPGRETGDFLHVLKGAKPFIANLHGATDSYQSWVFTSDEIKRLLKNPRYIQFVRTCFSMFSIVFVGISADDQAAGGQLLHLSKQRVDSGQHFWITNRSGQETVDWADQAGSQSSATQTRTGLTAAFLTRWTILRPTFPMTTKHRQWNLASSQHLPISGTQIAYGDCDLRRFGKH